MGSARQDDEHCAALAREAGILVAAVDYRLAPQHPYPAALHDCYDALAWLARQPEIDPHRIAVGGASAGGGLAAAVALRARDRSDVTLTYQLLAYPMLDDRTAARTDRNHGLRRLWDNKANAYAWSSYLGHAPGSAHVDALAAPARSTDLAGLPPTWIGVGTADLFYDEDADYAHRLQAAGVDCSLEIVDGAFHGFDVLRSTPIARRFQSQQSQALRAALPP